MRTFRYICVNRIRFLAEVGTKLQKNHFFGKFKDHINLVPSASFHYKRKAKNSIFLKLLWGRGWDHNSARKHGNQTNEPFFSSTFSDLTVCNVFVFENSQNSFSCGTLSGQFWSVKYISFWQKVPIQTAHQTFLEVRHPEVTKNTDYILSPEGSQIKRRYQLMDYK